MRTSMRLVSLVPAVLLAALFCAVSIPAFASGDDKPAAPNAPHPDREKKVFTNDDLDRMWPKQQSAPNASNGPQISPARPVGFQSQQMPASRTTNGSRAQAVVTIPERNPLWYAQQVQALSAELDRIAAQEQTLRAFRASGNAPGAGTGLQLNAPCEGYTTDNAIQQLAFRRQEIEQQLDDLADMAQRNEIPSGILRDPSAILDASERPITRAQMQRSIEQRQAELAAEIEGVHSELSNMSAQANAAGAQSSSANARLRRQYDHRPDRTA